jgi:hypothetical protein
MRMLRFLFPNGIGTRGVLAFVVIGVAAYKLPADALKDMAMMIVGAYFIHKASGTAPLPNGTEGGEK